MCCSVRLFASLVTESGEKLIDSLRFYYNSTNIVADLRLHKRLHKLPRLDHREVLSVYVCTFVFGVCVYLASEAVLEKTSPDERTLLNADHRPSQYLQPAVQLHAGSGWRIGCVLKVLLLINLLEHKTHCLLEMPY